LIGVTILVTLFGLWLGRFAINVERGVLRVRFGWGLPYYWKHFECAELTDVEAVTYRPIVNAGGWGVRWGRYEGEPTGFYSMSGKRGVRFRYDGKQYIIGSQQPERLARILAEGALKKD
jgi:hypothetical protein